MHTATGYLSPTAPFDFSKSLKFLGFFPPMQNEQGLAPLTLTKALSIQGQPIAFQLTSTGTIDEPQLAYTLLSEEPMTEDIQLATIDRITFFLGLEDDLRPFYAIGREDAIFAPIVEQLYGYHQVKFTTPFENTCWAVISQRNPMANAIKVKHLLTETFGSSITVNGIVYRAFPEPAQLVAADEDKLMSVIRHARRTEYVRSVAAAFDGVDEQFLRTAPYEEVEAWLQSIKGIGEWSANFVLLRGLGRMDRTPVTEKRMFEVVSRLYNAGQAVSAEDVRRIAEQYGPYQGYWAHYLRVAA
ncbi:MAG: DNA-3-methyladenine glycosylase 2 family protein [Ktedonobacteraceae bacterium]